MKSKFTVKFKNGDIETLTGNHYSSALAMCLKRRADSGLDCRVDRPRAQSKSLENSDEQSKFMVVFKNGDSEILNGVWYSHAIVECIQRRAEAGLDCRVESARIHRERVAA